MFIHIPTQQYPLTERDIRAATPSTSYSNVFQAPPDYAWVFPTPQPSFDATTHAARELPPVPTETGAWEQRWEIYQLLPAQAEVNQAEQAKALARTLAQQTQLRLDAFAQAKGYDDILSACTYAASAVPKFKAEGLLCAQQRDATWSALYQILADVAAGLRPSPAGLTDIEAELPALTWPD